MITVSGWYYLPDRRPQPDDISSHRWITRQGPNFSAYAAPSLLFPPLKRYPARVLPTALRRAFSRNMGMGRDNIQRLNHKAGTWDTGAGRAVRKRGIMLYSSLASRSWWHDCRVVLWSNRFDTKIDMEENEHGGWGMEGRHNGPHVFIFFLFYQNVPQKTIKVSVA